MESTWPSYLDSRSGSKVKVKNLSLNFVWIICITYDFMSRSQFQGHVINLFWVCFISPKLFELVSLTSCKCSYQWNIVNSDDLATLTQGQGHWSSASDLSLNLVSVSYFLNPEVNFSLNFSLMFLLGRRCLESLNRLWSLNFKLQGHVFYHSICISSLSPDPLGRFW